MKVLGLDQGDNLGWAIVWPEMERPISGTFKVDRARFGGRMGPALQTVRDFMTSTVCKHQVTHVCVEGLFIAKKNSKPDTVLPRAMITGTIELVAADFGLPASVAQVQAWRQVIIGVSRAPKYIKCSSSDWFKAQAFNYCDARGWPVLQDHEAEACCIAEYELCRLVPGYGAERQRKWGRAA